MSEKPHQMTKDAASGIQSTQAKGEKDMSSAGFAARAQSAGDHHENSNAGVGAGGNNSGGGNAGDGQGGQGGGVKK